MVYMYHSFLIHLSADGHLGCFHVLAIINCAVINIWVQVSLSDLVSSVCMPRSGIAGSYGCSISSFLRNLIYFFIIILQITFWGITISLLDSVSECLRTCWFSSGDTGFLTLFVCFILEYSWFEFLTLELLFKSQHLLSTYYAPALFKPNEHYVI